MASFTKPESSIATKTFFILMIHFWIAIVVRQTTPFNSFILNPFDK